MNYGINVISVAVLVSQCTMLSLRSNSRMLQQAMSLSELTVMKFGDEFRP